MFTNIYLIIYNKINFEICEIFDFVSIIYVILMHYYALIYINTYVYSYTIKKYKIK